VSAYSWRWKLGLAATAWMLAPFVAAAWLLERMGVPLTEECKEKRNGRKRSEH
jgi:hypothetical protein